MWATQEEYASDPIFAPDHKFKKPGHTVLVVGCILCLGRKRRACAKQFYLEAGACYGMMNPGAIAT